MVGDMENKVLCVISLLCPRLKVLLRSRWQSGAGAVQHKTLGTLDTARVWGWVPEKGQASGAEAKACPRPSAARGRGTGLDWAPGSVLGRHRHNHALERKPAIKLTAQITDFCLYNYTQLLSVHSLRHRRIHVSILSTQPGDALYLDDTLHLLIYSIYIPLYKDV